MKENVGTVDRAVRSIVGPLLIGLGARRWGGTEGDGRGLVAIMSGALVIDSAITRVCPLNALFGIDTRTSAQKARDLESALASHEGAPIALERLGRKVRPSGPSA